MVEVGLVSLPEYQPMCFYKVSHPITRFASIPDEVNALVFDLGTSLSRVGYAGEDTPKAVFPSWVGYTSDSTEGASSQPGTTDAEGDTIMGQESDPRVPSAGEEDSGGSCNGAGAKGKKKRPKRYVGEGEIYTWRENMELKNPFREGVGM